MWRGIASSATLSKKKVASLQAGRRRVCVGRDIMPETLHPDRAKPPTLANMRHGKNEQVFLVFCGGIPVQGWQIDNVSIAARAALYIHSGTEWETKICPRPLEDFIVFQVPFFVLIVNRLKKLSGETLGDTFAVHKVRNPGAKKSTILRTYQKGQ